MLVNFAQRHLLWAIWTWTIDRYLYIVIVIMDRRLQRNLEKIRQIEGESALPYVHEFFRLLDVKWNFCLLFHEDPDDGFDGDFQTQSDDAAADPLQLERQGHCWETRKLLEYLQQAMENCHFCKASWWA